MTVAGRKMLNLCANNYLGLADDPRLARAAKDAIDTHGYGMASVRFICGTQDLHRDLEQALAALSGPWTTPSCSPPVSTPMAVCSSRFWAQRTR